MKHIKKFNNGELLDAYKKSNFVTPHIYLDTNLNTVKFMQEYKQLEYISSTQTGGQYINLGCKLFENTDDIRIDIKTMLAQITLIIANTFSFLVLSFQSGNK